MFRFKSFALISKVLFEINSFARVEKTNSCSNTQRTLLVYISIKNNFFLILGVGLSAFPSVPPPFFEVGKWCKGKCYFLNHQIFSKDFSEFFQNLFFASLQTFCLIRSGCKGKSNFRISKRFWNFFFKISQNRFLSPRSGVFFSKRVQR